MSAPLPQFRKTTAAFFGGRQWAYGGDEISSSQGPGNGLAKKIPSTERVSGYLVTADEILHAAKWMLRKLKPEEVEAAVTAANDAPMKTMGMHCAVLVLQAQRSGDMALLFQAGHHVMLSYQQAQRASGPKDKDALSRLIGQYLEEMPDITPAELWRDFTGQADGGFGDVLVEYIRETDMLTYSVRGDPECGEENDLVDIDFEAFRRRVQRARKEMIKIL